MINPLVTLFARGIAAAAVLFAATVPAHAASYIRFDGVDGKTEVAGPAPAGCHDCWIELAAVQIVFPSRDGLTGLQPVRATASVSPATGKTMTASMLASPHITATIRRAGDGYCCDDVIVDGRIITAENYDSAAGQIDLLIADIRLLAVHHYERQRDGSFAQTAAGGWGHRGDPGFNGNPAIFDALLALGAVPQRDGSLLLTTAVPEPATYALWLAGIGMVFMLRMRRGA